MQSQTGLSPFSDVYFKRSVIADQMVVHISLRSTVGPQEVREGEMRRVEAGLC